MSPRSEGLVTAATPLGRMKFEQEPTGLWELAIGSTGGSLGETAGVLILLAGGYLACQALPRLAHPRLHPRHRGGAGRAAARGGPAPLRQRAAHALQRGLMLGAVYMATDLVTSPRTKPGAWIFGFGIGALVVLIRSWGGLPEGVMYAILLMNALVPAINRATRPRVFGTPAPAPRFLHFRSIRRGEPVR
jgi:Na+-translocating ferredoxin:NAD+ oxidoreductase subunit D